ncbi:MAG: alpha-L-rhamnosidase C-terminal domain-containing protein, partial [Bacteroidota bacterium]
VPNGAPWQPGCGGGVAWGAAICIMPWEFYQHYGSIDMLEDNFEAMKGYVRYLETWRRPDGVIHSQRRNGSGEVLRWFNLGEWVAPVELPPNELVHTFYFWRCADITARVADILGEEEESARFRMMANEAAEAFHSVFYDAEVASYGNYGGNIFALRMGVPEDRRDLVINTLRENIQSNAGHFDTGIFGTRFFFEVLTQHGMHDLAYQAITKREEPSFGRWLELGATTARERWDEGGSHNHPMFGGGLVWLYRYLAGMQIDEQQPGYRRLVFKPHPVEALSHVKYENQTPYGASGISWRSTNEAFEMSVTVPVGAEATVFVPSATDQQVVVDGERQLPSDIQSAGRADNYSIFHVGSGVYHFSVDGD